jgi:hypothetical protein
MNIMTTNEQLELGFNGIQPRPPGTRTDDRLDRAAWWFAQMRRIVANAMDWQNTNQRPTDQSWLINPQSK